MESSAQNISAKECFYNKDYETASLLFQKEKDYYGAGLCELLLGREDKAKNFFMVNKRNCPASQFALCILRLIHLKKDVEPTFFQTRALLEVYLNLFLETGHLEWAQNLVSCCDTFFSANPESYKFIARALFSNGYFDLAISFCKKSLRLIYFDPEALLILAQCQYLKEDLGEALDSVNKTLALEPNYYPALLFKNILKQEIEKKHQTSF